MRTSGILMPITSLPSPWGVGTIGGEARGFVDFLARAGVSTAGRCCPSGPPATETPPTSPSPPSPATPISSTWTTSPAEGLLERGGISPAVDWGHDRPSAWTTAPLYRSRFRRRCGERWAASGRRRPAELARFCEREAADWLDDYALFMALKDRQFGGAPWQHLAPTSLRLRRRRARLAAARRGAGRGASRFWQGVQYLFFTPVAAALKAAGRPAGGSRIIGRPPHLRGRGQRRRVEPARSSSSSTEDLRPTEVAGCPARRLLRRSASCGATRSVPLGAHEGGRLRLVAAAGIAFQFRLYDILRIDHFRGLRGLLRHPRRGGRDGGGTGAGSTGPGMDFFRACWSSGSGRRRHHRRGPGLPHPRGASRCSRDSGFPGMKVLQFAFDTPGRLGQPTYLPHRLPPPTASAYVGTHDNDTALGWLETAPAGRTSPFAQRVPAPRTAGRGRALGR